MLPDREKRPLRVVAAPATGHVVDAPPILDARGTALAFTCGHCGTVLLHANAGQIHGVVIRCTGCGSHNATDP